MLSQLFLALSLLGSAYTAYAAPTAAASSSPSNTTTTKQLSLQSSFIYELDKTNVAVPIITSTKGVKMNASVYIVDMENHSAADIKRYKDAGKTVVCYFSAGTWEPYRKDAKQFDPACYCGPNVKTDSAGVCIGTGKSKNLLGEWNEWWLDIHSDKCKQNVLPIQAARIAAAKAKGCDGLDPDNVDSYINKQSHGNSQKDQFDYLVWLADQAHAQGMLVDLKNSPDLITSSYGPTIVDKFDFSVIEECAKYKECGQYDAFLKAGKPQIQVEYSNSLKKCPSDQPAGRTVAVYSGTTLDTKKVTLYCPPK